MVAVEGASASGKTTIARALGSVLGSRVLAEAAEGLRPRPSLRYGDERALERLELRLLEAEAVRWEVATREAERGRMVLLDTAPFGPLTYTYGLVREREAPDSSLRLLTDRARTMVRRRRLGLPSITLYLDVPAAERTRRARQSARDHPPVLFERHQRVAPWERRLLLGPWRNPLRVRPIRVRAGRSAAETAQRAAELAVGVPVSTPGARPALRMLDELLRIAGRSTQGRASRSPPPRVARSTPASERAPPPP